MWNKLLTFILAVWLVGDLTIDVVDANSFRKLRLCVVQQKSNIKQMENVCKNFAGKDPIECVFESDRLGCMRRLTDSLVDFTVFEPEDLVVYSNIYSASHILITHELRLFINEISSFQMIALVTRDIHSLSELQGKKFCHPGFYSQSAEWTRIFANFFQSWITPKKCEPDATLIDNELSSLSEYFHSACIAGPWVPDVTEDDRLKRKYSNLHALCDNPNSRTTDDIYYGREGAIRCLIDDIGEIAWIRLADIEQYFKTFHMKNSSYNYLCPDGLARPVNNSHPCIWISRPWPVIAAHKNNAVKVSQLVRDATNKTLPWHKYLMEAMELYHITPVALDIIKTPEDYLHQFNGFSTANMRATCRPSRDVKWCIASTIENQKCQWMRDVAIAHGIEPAITCHQFDKRDGCFDAIKRGHSELFIVKPDEIKVAHDNNLMSLTHTMTGRIEDLDVYGIVVKNNSNLWTLDDLYDKRACFPRYRGIEWNAFVSVMRTQMIFKENNNKFQEKNSMWNCLDDEAMKNFFKEIIIISNEMTKNDMKIVENNLIESTYDCLISGRGDVAFVNIQHFSQKSIYRSKYKLRNICVDEMERKKNIECILTWTPLATIMVHANMTQLRRTEIQIMLSLMDELFGFKSHETNPIPFLLYGSFDKQDNIIFPMQTHYLQRDINHINKLPRNYFSILAQLEKTKNKLSVCNDANLYAANATIVLMAMMILNKLII
ncbi:hypothetical protein PV327_001293 [Microctonus hyperodae]|uniref:Transferrin-like domain-containing protein n=2 Tax=Microctonus hyperodae TaxID=165561 RepID=A0AA39G7Z7_MICHY|nr:hypothetical protein PV327_001293 [Microctonus hyperodae]